MGWLGIFQLNRVFIGKKNYFITTGTFLRNICWTKLLQKSYLNSLWASYPSPQSPNYSKTRDKQSSSYQSRKLLRFVYSGKSWWQCLLSCKALYQSCLPFILLEPPQVMAKVTPNSFFFFFPLCVCVGGWDGVECSTIFAKPYIKLASSFTKSSHASHSERLTANKPCSQNCHKLLSLI